MRGEKMKKVKFVTLVVAMMLLTAAAAYAGEGASTFMGSYGVVLAVLGGAVAVFFAGFGSCIGIGIAGQAANGLLGEDPERFGSLLVFVALPGTQGIYGFIGAFLIIAKIKAFFASSLAGVPIDQGWAIFFAALPVGFGGLVSAVHQGKVCAAGVAMSAKQPEAAMKGVIYAAMVETYSIFGLLATILLLQQITP
jgi:V/A-type H+-transporting ATPase subunit K